MIADLGDYFILLKESRIFSQGRRETVFPLLGQGNVRPPCWWLHGGSGPEFLG